MRFDRGLMRRAAGAAEAAVALTLAQLALRLLPFRWLAPAVVRSRSAFVETAALSNEVDAGSSSDSAAKQNPGAVFDGNAIGRCSSPDPRAARVGASVASAAVRLPWHSTCLVRALAARLMLARRGVPSVLYLGVAKGADKDADKDGAAFRAHAWLLAGGGVVCGGREAPAYTAIAAFSERLS